MNEADKGMIRLIYAPDLLNIHDLGRAHGDCVVACYRHSPAMVNEYCQVEMAQLNITECIM